jgi:hypothetical protein
MTDRVVVSAMDAEGHGAPPSGIPAALARWKSLPRAAKWAVYGGLFVAAYFAVVQPVLDKTNALSAAADLAALQLRQYDTQEASRAEALARIAMGASAFGPVTLPAKDPTRVSSVSDAIARVLGDRGVVEWNVQTQRSSALGRGVLPGLIKPDTEELQRVVFTVTLTDRTATVLGVIADLERMPEIATIGQVQLRRAEKGKDRISATITPEVWVIVSREGAR